MPDTTLNNRVQLLSPTYRKFVLSSFAAEAAELFGTGEQLSPDQIIVLENGLALYLLFFLDAAELIAFIRRECEIDTTAAEQITYAFLATLPPEFTEEQSRICQALTTNATAVAIPTVAPNTTTTQPANVTPNQQLASDIAEAEAALRSLEPVRTMAHDMNLARHPSPIPTPAPNSNPIPATKQSIPVRSTESPISTAPKWDSEQ